MKSRVYFADDDVRAKWTLIQSSTKSEDRHLHTLLNKVFDKIAENAFSGTQIPKRQIPKEYHHKYGPLYNLWKMNISRKWRLIYTVATDDEGTISVIIEWMDHTEYERRFGYTSQ